MTWIDDEIIATYNLNLTRTSWSIGNRRKSMEKYSIIDGVMTFAEGTSEINGYGVTQYLEMKKVVIPGSVEQIGEADFMDCKMLEEVVISEGVKEIGPLAFWHCENLKKVVFPDTLTSIGLVSPFLQVYGL